MFKESLITDALANLKYVRLKHLTYRASWSTSDVEHFLYFSRWGTPKNFLTAYFGLRNAGAEEFGIECIRAYGGDLYRILKHDARVDCTMTFSLGNLAGWSPRWSLYIPKIPTHNGVIPEISMASLGEKIRIDVRECLFPIIHDVTSLDRLLSLLLKDVEPCRWFRVNGAIRAAQIAYLARRLGLGTAEITSMLKPFEKELRASLVRGPNPASYINDVVKRSAEIDTPELRS